MFRSTVLVGSFRSLGALAFLVFALVFAGFSGATSCAASPLSQSARAVPTPTQSSIAVTLPCTPDQALERVKAVMLEAGLAIDNATTAGVLSTAPVVPDQRAAFPSEVVYRATILATGGDSSRVVLSGETRPTAESGRARTVTPLNSRQASYDAAHGSHGWAKLEQLARALEASR